MLVLYLYTLIIGYKSCNMLSILSKLTLLNNEIVIFVEKMFLDKTVKARQKQNKRLNRQTLAGTGN